MAKRSPTASQFTAALRAIPKPGGKQLQFLTAHYRAPGRATTAAKLARAVKYQSWRAINLRYGLLAQAIADAMRKESTGLGLLMEFAEPKTVTNEHWILVMRPEFANALRHAGWISGA